MPADKKKKVKAAAPAEAIATATSPAVAAPKKRKAVAAADGGDAAPAPAPAPAALKAKKKVVKPAASASVAEEAAPKKRKLAADEQPAKKAKVSDGKKSKASSSTDAVAAPASAVAASPKGDREGARSPLSQEQVRKAVVALCTHLERQRAASGGGKNMLEDDDDGIYVVLATKTMPNEVSKAKKDKAVKLQLPNPLASIDEKEICLICKDPQREFKDKLAEQVWVRVWCTGPLVVRLLAALDYCQPIGSAGARLFDAAGSTRPPLTCSLLAPRDAVRARQGDRGVQAQEEVRAV